MKIIEALKKLRLIEKKMDGNNARITQYSSILSTERPIFETEAKQRAEVTSLLQANMDLLKEYLRLKCDIEKTNLTVEVKTSIGTYTIAELLILKRTLAQKARQTYEALQDGAAMMRMRNAPSTGDKPVQLIRMYDETVKNAGIRSWMEFHYEIDGTLEVVNATTDLIESK